MSRKLIYVSGLLACFSGHMFLRPEDLANLIRTPNATYEFIRLLRRTLSQTPLEIVASVINRWEHLRPLGVRLFGAYDQCLAVLADDEKRAHLDRLTQAAESGDGVYQQLRTASHQFRGAVLDLFFDEETGLNQLTRTYGIF